MFKLRNKKRKSRSRWLSATVLAVSATSMLTTMASQINVYEVTDSIRTTEIKTFSDDAEDAYRLAGYDSDAYALVADSGEEGLVRRLRMEKKFPVIVSVDGAQTQIKTISGTVRDIISAQGVTLGEYDEVTPAADTHLDLTNQMQTITVARITKENLVQRVTVPYKTQKRNTSELTYGNTRVTQKGIDGTADQEVVVTKRDGVEIAREVQKETIIVEPQQEILEIGTGGAVVTRGGEALRYSSVFNMKATAYSTEGWSRENKVTAIGTLCRVGAVAVDPKVIPLGSRLYITSPDGKQWIYGTAVAEDTGGAIKGNRIDLYFNTQAECRKFGVQGAKVYVLSE